MVLSILLGSLQAPLFSYVSGLRFLGFGEALALYSLATGTDFGSFALLYVLLLAARARDLAKSIADLKLSSV